MKILITFFFAILICSSAQTVTKTLNLQPNESYQLDLDQFYSFSAASFDWPQNLPAAQIIDPYQIYTSNKSTGNAFTTLATFLDLTATKYSIGYRQEQSQDGKTFDLIIVYNSIMIDPATGIASRKEIGSNTIQKGVKISYLSILIEGSLFSSSQGFITLSIRSVGSNVLYFSYSQDQGLVINTVNKVFIGAHISVLNPLDNSIVHLIYYNNNKVTYLLAYHLSDNTITQEGISTFSNGESICSVLAAQDSLIVIANDQNEQLLYSFTVNMQSQTLNRDSIDLPVEDGVYCYSYIQKQNNSFFISGFKYDLTNMITYVLDFNAYVNRGRFEYVRTYQTKYYKQGYQKPLFIDEKTMVFFLGSKLLMMNALTNQVIFEVVLSNLYSINTSENIGNQLFLYQVDNEEQTTPATVTPIKLQHPSITLIGQEQVYKIPISPSQSGFGINLVITINPTQNLLTTINQPIVELWNYIAQLPFFSNEQNIVPIEQYITGSDITLSQAIAVSNKIVSNVYFQQIGLPVSIIGSFDNSNYFQSYQLDGYFSSLVLNASADRKFFGIQLKRCEFEEFNGCQSYNYNYQLESGIQIIDNYGSFILSFAMSQDTISINVPFTREQKVYYNQIPNLTCASGLAFASDPSNNIIFILCGSKIQVIRYMQNFDLSKEMPNASIISSSFLSQDYSSFKNLICIKGKLFIYSDQQIAMFDYINNNYGQKIISIPSLSQTSKQQLTLFSSSFIITVLDNPVQTIKQFSYGHFSSENPQFQRNLSFGKYTINPSVKLIAVRNGIEYLYVSLTTTDEYAIYRINNCYSQNQLYTTTEILPNDTTNLTIISSDYVCNLFEDNSYCQRVYESANLSYSINIKKSDFISNQVFSTAISLSINDLKQTYNLQIIRDASNKNTVINDQAPNVLQLQEQIKNVNFTSSTIFQFNDTGVDNSCLLGWTTGLYSYSVSNRLSGVKNTSNIVYAQTIMYNMQVLIDGSKLTFGNGLLVIEDINVSQNCWILDDQSSKVLSTTTNSFSINVYALCVTKLLTYSITFNLDSNNENYVSAINNVPNKTVVFNRLDSVKQIQKLLTINGQRVVFDLINGLSYLISENESNALVMSQIDIDITSPISTNVINSLSLQVSFFINGGIEIMNTKLNVKQTTTLQTLLSQSNANSFYFQEGDIVSSVNQYSDTSFTIQYKNSFLYDITFALDNQNQVFIQFPRMFYYKDVIDSVNNILKMSRYTLIFGYHYGELYASLYGNSKESSDQLLIQSSYDIGDKCYLTYAQVLNQSTVQLYFSNGNSVILSISDTVGIRFFASKSSYLNSQLTLYPITQASKAELSLLITEIPFVPVSPSSSTTTFNRILTFKSIILSLFALIMFI